MTKVRKERKVQLVLKVLPLPLPPPLPLALPPPLPPLLPLLLYLDNVEVQDGGELYFST